MNLAVAIEDPDSGKEYFARVKVPSLLKPNLHLPNDARYVPLEQLITSQLARLFHSMIMKHQL